jgi:hypothetical protein
LHDAQTFFAFTGERVVETDALDETAITAVTRVGRNDIEERALLGDGSRPWIFSLKNWVCVQRNAQV